MGISIIHAVGLIVAVHGYTSAEDVFGSFKLIGIFSGSKPGAAESDISWLKVCTMLRNDRIRKAWLGSGSELLKQYTKRFEDIKNKEMSATDLLSLTWGWDAEMQPESITIERDLGNTNWDTCDEDSKRLRKDGQGQIPVSSLISIVSKIDKWVKKVEKSPSPKPDEKLQLREKWESMKKAASAWDSDIMAIVSHGFFSRMATVGPLGIFSRHPAQLCQYVCGMEETYQQTLEAIKQGKFPGDKTVDKTKEVSDRQCKEGIERLREGLRVALKSLASDTFLVAAEEGAGDLINTINDKELVQVWLKLMRQDMEQLWARPSGQAMLVKFVGREAKKAAFQHLGDYKQMAKGVKRALDRYSRGSSRWQVVCGSDFSAWVSTSRSYLIYDLQTQDGIFTFFVFSPV